jgi:hypothetical protein
MGPEGFSQALQLFPGAALADGESHVQTLSRLKYRLLFFFKV